MKMSCLHYVTCVTFGDLEFHQIAKKKVLMFTFLSVQLFFNTKERFSLVNNANITNSVAITPRVLPVRT